MSKNDIDKIETPSFVFDCEKFAERVRKVKGFFRDIPITFSIKANPFLVPFIPDEISFLEVCSPGELEICIKNRIAPEKIIYSGVNKGEKDILRAMEYGAAIVTAESPLQYELESETANRLGKTFNVILRLSSGNQFGMSEENIEKIIAERDGESGLRLYGLHYFSGTQKDIKSIKKDAERISAFVKKLSDTYDFIPELVEFGPGLKTEYYNGNCEETDMDLLKEAAGVLDGLSKEVRLGLEFGRFLAAACGTYYTRVCDIKKNGDGNYVICDGGINQLVYYGQNMAMKVPPITVIKEHTDQAGITDHCLCGSLCTVADVLVRKAALPRLNVGDIIAFGKCGAYSVTEGTALFLSRQLPAVYIRLGETELKKVRDMTDTFDFNMQQEKRLRGWL